MIAAILVSIVTGLLVNEFCDVSPWCACKLVRWSAFRLYSDPARAKARAEELGALINDRPGKLFKLITAVCFTAKAAVRSRPAYRRTPARTKPPSQSDPSVVLTRVQRQVLQVIRDSVQTRGYAPSKREIADAVGLVQVSTVSLALSSLVDNGYLVGPSSPRIQDDIRDQTREGKQHKKRCHKRDR